MLPLCQGYSEGSDERCPFPNGSCFRKAAISPSHCDVGNRVYYCVCVCVCPHYGRCWSYQHSAYGVCSCVQKQLPGVNGWPCKIAEVLSFCSGRWLYQGPSCWSSDFDRQKQIRNLLPTGKVHIIHIKRNNYQTTLIENPTSHKGKKDTFTVEKSGR